jgi:hypothetical protein
LVAGYDLGQRVVHTLGGYSVSYFQFTV